MDRAIEALIAILGADKGFLPGSAQYNTSLSSYFSPQAAAVHPACSVAPQSATDVSAVVTSLTSNGPCDFAVRAGGHTWFADANSAPGGITVDLRGLNSIELNADKSTVSVGSGATWDAAYRELEHESLSVAGGRVAGVAVGGLTLGGRISYFAPREGLACNQVMSFEVVLADGSVVVADAQQNAGLCWGLRRVEQLRHLDSQASIYGELIAAENYDVKAFFLTGWASASQYDLSVTLNYNASATATVANMSTIAQNAVALQAPQAARYMTATTTFAPTEAMIRATYEAFNASLPLVQNVAGIMWAVNIEPLPPQIYERGVVAGGH
ncbi:hypothetical protein GGR53DRAFT_468473 [Hypoxylon sp. FL1150]|nr:hypothetical protein GGR53DRAFT_468473 [Hypoxylon sp. FL1150]